MQYTLRNIPKATDRALRDRARAEGKSLNATLLDAIHRGLGLNGQTQHDDLDWFLGTGGLEPSVLKVIKSQDVVHPDDWK